MQLVSIVKCSAVLEYIIGDFLNNFEIRKDFLSRTAKLATRKEY